MKLSIGNSVWVEHRRRTIVRFLKNTKGNTIIEWASKHNIGVCVPTIWDEWKHGVDQTENRARNLCVCTKNFIVEIIRNMSVAARIPVKAVTKKEALEKISKKYPREQLRVFYARRHTRR